MSRLCVDKQLRIIAVTKKYVEKVARFGSLFAQDNLACGKRKGNASIQVKSPSNPQFGESLPHSCWAILRPVPRVKKEGLLGSPAAWTANEVVC
jgi:hypothetical protein